MTFKLKAAFLFFFKSSKCHNCASFQHGNPAGNTFTNLETSGILFRAFRSLPGLSMNTKYKPRGRGEKKEIDYGKQ